MQGDALQSATIPQVAFFIPEALRPGVKGQ